MVDQVSKLLMLLVRLFPEKGVLFARILTAFEKSALFAHNSNVRFSLCSFGASISYLWFPR